jgi:hypothetical protein
LVPPDPPLISPPISPPLHSTARARPPTECPEDLTPNAATAAFIERHCQGAQVDRELAKFIAYWRGRGEKRADWQHTLRNWMEKATPSDRRPGPAPSSPARRSEGMAALMEIVERSR